MKRSLLFLLGMGGRVQKKRKKKRDFLPLLPQKSWFVSKGLAPHLRENQTMFL
ncbi:MAG: hypothetical protein AB1397_03175 [bacterium]